DSPDLPPREPGVKDLHMSNAQFQVPAVTPVVRSDAMDVFFAWEKLRVFYNLVLAGPVLSHAIGSGIGMDIAFWLWVCEWAFGANLAYCAGSVAEGYLCILGFDRRCIRWCVFVAGLLLSVLSTFVALGRMAAPHPAGMGGGFLS